MEDSDSHRKQTGVATCGGPEVNDIRWISYWYSHGGLPKLELCKR